jgi:tetratricopeptide (TPR) repeat protein
MRIGIRDSRLKIEDLRLRVIGIVFLAMMMISCPYSFAFSVEDMQALQKADNLRADGKTHEALAEYEKILEKSPNTDLKDEILVQMASCYIQLGDDDSAIKSYLKVISSNPDSMDSANAVSLMANMFTQRYQYEDMLAISKQIIQQFPGTESAAMASYRIANYLYSKGDNGTSIKEYKDFLSLYPKSTLRSSALNRLIYLYIAESMFKEAEDIINTTLAENPNNTYILRQLALVYRKQGKYDDALDLYQKIQSASPNDPDMYEQIGEIYVEKGDQDKAIAEWYKITSNNQGQYYFHQMLAGIFKSHGLYDQAAQEYQKAINLQPMASYIYNQLAELHIVNKKYDSAMDVYLQALMTLPANYPDRSEIVNNVLEISQLDGLHDKVISKLKTQTSQNNVSAMSALADIYFYNGEIGESIDLYKKVALRFPSNSNLLFERAEWLKRERQLENAIKMYEAILEIYPDTNFSIDALINIGQLQAELDKPNEAIANLKSVALKTRNLSDEKSNSQLVSALMMTGDIYLKQLHDTKASLSAYQEAEIILKRQSYMITEISELYLKMADCYRIMGVFDMASKALESIPEDNRSALIEARMAKLQGDCYFNMGDFDNAKIQYKKATKSNLKEDWANDALDRLALIAEYSVGALQELLKSYANVDRMKEAGEYDRALSEYQNAIKAYPSSGLTDRIKLEIGSLLTQKERYNEAIETYEVLIRSNSQFAPEAQFRIAGIYSQNLNDSQRAIEAYSKLIRDYPDSILVSDARKQLQRLSVGASPSVPHLP